MANSAFGTYGNCSHVDRMGKMHSAIDNETLNDLGSTNSLRMVLTI